MSEFALEMLEISKSFPGVQALKSANLSIRTGEIHGLVGENGAGKSTIIKVLAGVYQNESGVIKVEGKELASIDSNSVRALGIRFVHQELHLVPTFTVAESVFMGHELTGKAGIRKKEMVKRAEKTLLDILGVQLDGRTLIRDLSPAERKLVQIARALVDEGAKLVVFDEPTAPLAASESEKVLAAIRRLRASNIATLYVSHYLGEITDLCDRVTVFRDGRDVGVLETITKDSGTDLVQMMVGRNLDQLFPEKNESFGQTTLNVVGISDGSRFEDVNIDVMAGEVVGIVGLLGSGSEEIVDSLVGLRKIKSGRIQINGVNRKITSPASALKQGLVLIPRDRRNDGLVLNLSVDENINLSTLDAVSRLGLVNKVKAKLRAEASVRALDIRPSNTKIMARLLSGGNQQKVVLARSLAAEAKILILDEPTIGVDVGAKSEIYRLVSDLSKEGRAILISSNDPSEILGLCHRVLVVMRGKVVSTHLASELTRGELVARMTGSQSAKEMGA